MSHQLMTFMLVQLSAALSPPIIDYASIHLGLRIDHILIVTVLLSQINSLLFPFLTFADNLVTDKWLE